MATNLNMILFAVTETRPSMKVVYGHLAKMIFPVFTTCFGAVFFLITAKQDCQKPLFDVIFHAN